MTKNAVMWIHPGLTLWCITSALAATATLPAAAQVATAIVRDGRLGAGPGTALLASGIVTKGTESYRRFTIPDTYGARAGSNVFHSFATFNVGSGDGAVFTISAPTTNLISRVTGGQVSSVNGLISVDPGATGSTPNFFFINPAGFTFGAGAAVDVPGAFHVSTANYLKFADGNFHADPAAGSTLSAAPPLAFGFLGATRASILVRDGATIITRPRQALSVVAGDMEISNASVQTEGGGDIRVAAVGKSAVEVGLTGPLAQAAGRLDILNGGFIRSASGERDAGTVSVSAGDILVDGREGGFAGIFSRASENTTGNAGDVSVTAAASVSILSLGEISSVTHASGRAGTVNVKARELTIDDRSLNGATGIYSESRAGSTGDAGRTAVTVSDRLTILNGGQVASNTYAAGRGGTVAVEAGELYVDGGGKTPSTGIFSQAQRQSTENAGDVNVVVHGPLSLANGGVISSTTFARGNAGTVTISADRISVDGRTLGNLGTGIISDAAAGSMGDAGAVDISVSGNLMILSTGQISSSTYSKGNAGTVKVRAGDIALDGRGVAVGTGTGVFSQATSGSAGNSGNVDVAAAGLLSIVNGAAITSGTFSSGHAGSVRVQAASMVLDGMGSENFTGVFSTANRGSTGNAGSLDVVVAGSLQIADGAQISSSTSASGTGGVVRVRGGDILIDGRSSEFLTGIISESTRSNSGAAGNVDVNAAGRLSIVSGGGISSSTSSSGNAGVVKVSAAEMIVDGRNLDTFTGISSSAERGSTGNAGAVEVTVAGRLDIMDGGQISSDTSSSGAGGTVKVNARELHIDGHGATSGIFSDVNAGGRGQGGSVEVEVSGELTMLNGGVISSSTYSRGNAGSVNVVAGAITIDGKNGDTVTGIASDAQEGTGNAGIVEVRAGTLKIFDSGAISSHTFTSGNAGTVKVTADTILIDGKGNGDFITGISSSTEGSGKAGNVEVVASRQLTILNGGTIASDTDGPNNAGSISVVASSITLDGSASDIFTGISSDANVGSTGHAGDVDVRVTGKLTLMGGAAIQSDTFAKGDAGSVKVSAESIEISSAGDAGVSTISSSANKGSAGNAGRIEVQANGDLRIVDAGLISTSTRSVGNAGSVTVEARSITIDGGGKPDEVTGIVSNANRGSVGNAGDLAVTVGGALQVLGTGEISSSTSAAGRAGRVTVGANTISVDSGFIVADASAGSSGKTGNVSVTASGGIALSNAGKISILNRATVADPAGIEPTALTVTAPRIDLRTGSTITAASEGNVAASAVTVNFTDTLALDAASINTSANIGNGGNIRIQGGNLIDLHNSQFATSVQGLTGNGGNIAIGARSLVLKTGFVQANTAAQNAAGGDVRIDVQNLVPSGNTLLVGGQSAFGFDASVFGFNLIQAAAPTGLSGTVTISSPTLDIAGALTGLSTSNIDAGGLGRSPCQTVGGSSLAVAGRGGLPPSARDLVGPADSAAAAAPRQSALSTVPLSALPTRFAVSAAASCLNR